jgi:hypothetical protein
MHNPLFSCNFPTSQPVPSSLLLYCQHIKQILQHESALSPSSFANTSKLSTSLRTTQHERPLRSLCRLTSKYRGLNIMPGLNPHALSGPLINWHLSTLSMSVIHSQAMPSQSSLRPALSPNRTCPYCRVK